MNAGSFPPSSIQVGIITSAAAEATFFPTGSLPMTEGQHVLYSSNRLLTGNMSDKLVLGHRLRQIREADDKL
jgi:hypothetical protein